MADLSLSLSFEDFHVRVVGSIDNPQWVASDVCNILGLNTSLAVNGRSDRPESGLDDDEKGIAIVNTLGGEQEMLTVNEPGLYQLIFKSRKPIAKRLKRWIAHEVLPAIRKHGFYGVSNSAPIWHQRLIAFHQARPVLPDRFCTFEMTNHYVAAPLEGAGYVMHDNMMPDLSIGLGYRYFLQRLGYDLDDPNVRTHYDLEIPCYNSPGEWQVVSPWQYNNDLLPTFVKYINDYWKPNRMLSYFTERDDSALQAVSHVLGLPYQDSLFQLEGFD